MFKNNYNAKDKNQKQKLAEPFIVHDPYVEILVKDIQ